RLFPALCRRSNWQFGAWRVALSVTTGLVRLGRRIHLTHRVSGAGAAVGDEIVEHVATLDQPLAVDPSELVLIGAIGADLGLVAFAMIGHFEPLRAGPGAIAFDADR